MPPKKKRKRNPKESKQAQKQTKNNDDKKKETPTKKEQEDEEEDEDDDEYNSPEACEARLKTTQIAALRKLNPTEIVQDEICQEDFDFACSELPVSMSHLESYDWGTLDVAVKVALARKRLAAWLSFIARLSPKRYDAQLKRELAEIDVIDRSVTDE
jgi:hypothetical protein